MKLKFITYAFATLFTFTTPSYGIEIIPHFTNGPTSGANAGLGVPFTGPKPILPGSNRGVAGQPATGTDCNAIVLEDRFTTQTGAVCRAIEELEAIIKDDINVDIEFYAINRPALGAFLEAIIFARTINSPLLNGAGYNTVRELLKTDENQERYALLAPSYIPSFADLKINLPRFAAATFKSQAIILSRAQLRALGIALADSVAVFGPNTGNVVTLSGVLGVIRHQASTFMPPIYDFDTRNGIGAGGPHTLASFDSLSATNPLPGIYSNDYKGAMIHEIMHVLGYWSHLDGGPTWGPPLAANSRGIFALDLFRFAETDVVGPNATLTDWNQYQQLPRHLKERENVPLSTDLPVEPHLGNNVLVFNLKPNKSVHYIPMAGGGSAPGFGDRTSASHSRSPFYWSEQGPSQTPGILLWNKQTFIEDRCPIKIKGGNNVSILVKFNQTLRPEPHCNPVVGDPNHIPTGRIMDPLNQRNVELPITIADAIALDLIGYEVDYTKLKENAFPGVVTVNIKSNADNQVNTSEMTVDAAGDLYQVESSIIGVDNSDGHLNTNPQLTPQDLMDRGVEVVDVVDGEEEDSDLLTIRETLH